MSKSKFKLGCLPRAYNPKVPHMSMMLAGKLLPVPPVSIDWTKGITDWGMMLNNSLGDCTCAAVFHARQIWTANVLTEQTEANSSVLKLYESACGYNPNDPSTDQGGIEQNVLTYLLNTGIPLSDGSYEKILAFVEVDVRNITDVKLTIAEFGVAYLGIHVPASIYGGGNQPLTTWDYDPTNTDIEGGHAIIAVAYDDDGVTVISWGSLYKLTWAFFITYTQECYAIVSPDWINSTGKTPLGLTVQELEEFMVGIRE